MLSMLEKETETGAVYARALSVSFLHGADPCP